MALSGGPEAKVGRAGLIDEVVNPGLGFELASNTAARLGELPGRAYAATKEALHRPVLDAMAQAPR